MSSLILVAYATRYGSTREVAESIAAVMREGGFDVEVKPAREVRAVQSYVAIVLGAPLLMFRWHKDAINFLLRHQKSLAEFPAAVFALGPTHDPYDEKEWQDAHKQFDKELAQVAWFSPVARKVFGGKYDPSKLGFPLKMFAGSVPESDIRDWEAIRSWAGNLPKQLTSE